MKTQMSEKWRRENVNQQIPFVYHFPGYCYCYGYYYQTPNTFGYSSKKKWTATRLPVDLAAFKKERNRVMNLMNEARLVYYNPFIEDNSTDGRRLFAASKSLMNMKKDWSLPHILMFHCLQTIWVIFIAKITNIRSKLDGILPSHPLLSTPEPSLESESGNFVFFDFQCQTTETVRHVITSGKKKSCILDPIPASLLSAITNMVNLSLQTGYFADTWKNCCGIPIIKKPASLYCSRISSN